MKGLLQKLLDFWDIQSKGWERVFLLLFPLYYIIILLEAAGSVHSISSGTLEQHIGIIGFCLVSYILIIKSIIWIINGFKMDKKLK